MVRGTGIVCPPRVLSVVCCSTYLKVCPAQSLFTLVHVILAKCSTCRGEVDPHTSRYKGEAIQIPEAPAIGAAAFKSRRSNTTHTHTPAIMAHSRTQISSGWTFKQQDWPSEEWLPVSQVPSQIHMDLLANKKYIPVPFSLLPLSSRTSPGIKAARTDALKPQDPRPLRRPQRARRAVGRREDVGVPRRLFRARAGDRG